MNRKMLAFYWYEYDFTFVTEQYFWSYKLSGCCKWTQGKKFYKKASKKNQVAKIIFVVSKHLSIFICSSGQEHDYLVWKE